MQNDQSTPTGAAEVRRATKADLDALVPLFDQYRQFYGQAPDASRARVFLSERIDRRESIIFLATLSDGSGVGFTQLYPCFSSISTQRSLILNDLFVASHARRRGIAVMLMNAASEYARDVGAAFVELSTARANYAAQRLYESLGYLEDRKFVTYRLAISNPRDATFSGSTILHGDSTRLSAAAGPR